MGDVADVHSLLEMVVRAPRNAGLGKIAQESNP